MERSGKTVIIQSNDAVAWDAFVSAHPGAEYCHLFPWCKVIEEVYRHRPYYLAAVDEDADRKQGGAIRGVFPLFQFKPLLRKPKLISMPFFDQAGLLAENREIEAMLFSAGLRLFRSRDCSSLEIRQAAPSPFLGDQGPENLRSRASTLKVSLKVQLGSGQKELLQGFKSKLRSQINKGWKNGLQSQIGKEELLEPFYQVFSRNMRDLGSPVHSKKFFEAIFRYFQEHASICLVTFRAQPVAAGFLFKFRDEIKNPWASSLKEFRHLNANMILYWEMIRFACEQKMRCFDMGRSSLGAPTYRFKKQWSPEEKQLYWYSWLPDDRDISEKLETLTIQSWNRLPMPVANILGPLVRRNISL